jgi:hypothetical protein
MTSVLDIANRALSAIGARSGSAGSTSALSSLNENSNEAFQVNLLFNSTRDDLLRSAHWNFAAKTATLSLLKSAPGTPQNPTTSAVAWNNTFPAPPWLYEYGYPSDCLKMRQLAPPGQYSAGGGNYAYPVGFNFGGACGPLNKFIVATDADSSGNPMSVVLTNVFGAIGVYTQQIINPDMWDVNFQSAMVAGLAARLVMPLTGDRGLAQMLVQETQMYVQNARVSDGNEGTTSVEREAEWIMARGQGGGWIGTGFYAPWDSIGWLGF